MEENIIEEFDGFNPIVFNKYIKQMLPQFNKKYRASLYNRIVVELTHPMLRMEWDSRD